MPRLSNKPMRKRNNKGAHQRRRTTRGHRAISKFVKYKWYEEVNKNIYNHEVPTQTQSTTTSTAYSNKHRVLS